ncbi:MAG: hypothetical protein ACTSRC_16915 [Candidatus Helarchaeota archaeon]
MKVMKQKRNKFTVKLSLVLILGILISIQVYSVVIHQGYAAYLGIYFGSETELGADTQNDIWKVETSTYTYTALNQTKPDVDLIGLTITRGLNRFENSSESETMTLNATNNALNYIYNYTFSFPVAGIENISYTFVTNQTYDSSSIQFKNHTDGLYYNVSPVCNITPAQLLPSYYYSAQNISIQFNITHSAHFVFWFNLTFIFCLRVDQMISLQFNALANWNSSLYNHLKAWVFLDTDSDDRLNYAIQWIYGNGTYLYSIANGSFTLGGWWNGQFNQVWTGPNWRTSTSEIQKDLGISENNELNFTIPSYLINLTSNIRYTVWALLMEKTNHWWDVLPNDPNWSLTPTLIPGFHWLLIMSGIALIGLIHLIKRKGQGIIKKWI